MKHKLIRFSSIAACVSFLTVFFGAAIINTPSTEAISAMDFKAGNIIDDGVFYNKNTMTIDEINISQLVILGALAQSVVVVILMARLFQQTQHVQNTQNKCAKLVIRAIMNRHMFVYRIIMKIRLLMRLFMTLKTSGRVG